MTKIHTEMYRKQKNCDDKDMQSPPKITSTERVSQEQNQKYFVALFHNSETCIIVT